MGRKPCCEKVGLKKGSWTAEEDKKLIDFMLTGGHFCSWRAVPELAGLLRCGKSCRLRWTNYLRPDLRRGLLSVAEEKLVIELQSKLGNRWSKIAAHLPGRTDNEIKNLWNTHIKKKVTKLGVDPTAARAGWRSCDADVVLVDCPEFGVDEVPIAQPDEIVVVIPCAASAWTPTSRDLPPSSCPSPGSSAGDSSPATMEFMWDLGDDRLLN